MTTPNDPSQQPSEPPPPTGPQGYQPPPPPPGTQQQPPGYQPPPAYSTEQGFPAAPPVQPQYGYGQAATAPPGMYVDAASGLVLPNGTQLAPVGRRIGAWFLSIVLAIVTLGIGYLIWGLVLWGRGQTPALKVLGMRVWRPDDQKPPGFGYMALREIIGRIVDGILSFITGLISFIMMISSKEHRTLHDLVAGTVVLYDPNKVIPGA